MSHGYFENRVLRRLRRQVRRLRMLRVLDGLGAVSIVLLAVLAVQLLLDWGFRLRLDMRAALLVVVAAVTGWAAWRNIIAPLRLPFGVREMACALERRFPQLDALLISAVRFHSGSVGAPASNSPQLVASVIEQAARASESISFDKALETARTRRAAAKILCVATIAVVSLVAAPQTLGIWFERNLLLRDVDWPKRTRLIVEVSKDGILRGALGDDLEVRASVAAGYDVPRLVEIVCESRAGKTGREAMTGVGRRGFRMTFLRVREPFRFYLTGGDDTTAWYEVKLSERPRIESATLTVAAPAYTRLEPVTLPPGQRAAEMYLGSTLTIRATCSKPVVRAALVSSSETVVELERPDPELVATVSPTESRTYHFTLVDADGLENARPVRFSARVFEDQAPKVRLKLSNVGNMVTRQAVLPVEAEFTDQLGLAEAVLAYQTTGPGATLQIVPLEGFAPHATKFSLRYEWPVASTGAAVGEQVSIFARARDFDDVSGPNVGESTTITFRVVTDEELRAEFSRREQEYRRQFDRVVDSQERLRGKLLTVLGRLGDHRLRDDLELLLAPLERRQRQIVSQVGIIRQQFEQVLFEMAVNRLDSVRVRRRLEEGIIDPLGDLGARDLGEAADQLSRLARENSMELARAVDPLQGRILERMRLVLENMLKWEGYQETVSMLREILRLQQELNAETRQEIERRSGDIFDD